jgi:uncharacterized membrane protein YdbT with pleckstrin-like domain
MAIGAGIFISCLIACFIGFVLGKTTTVRIRKAGSKIKDAALVMSIEMNKAEAAHHKYTQMKGEETKHKNEEEAAEWKEMMARKKEEVEAIKQGRPLTPIEDQTQSNLIQE